MMLRASIDDHAVAVEATRARLLEDLVDAVASPSSSGAALTGADEARSRVAEQLGADWLVDACAVIANFEMMTRIADGTGARLRPEQLAAASGVIAEQGLDSFPSAPRDAATDQTS